MATYPSRIVNKCLRWFDSDYFTQIFGCYQNTPDEYRVKIQGLNLGGDPTVHEVVTAVLDYLVEKKERFDSLDELVQYLTKYFPNQVLEEGRSTSNPENYDEFYRKFQRRHDYDDQRNALGIPRVPSTGGTSYSPKTTTVKVRTSSNVIIAPPRTVEEYMGDVAPWVNMEDREVTEELAAQFIENHVGSKLPPLQQVTYIISTEGDEQHVKTMKGLFKIFRAVNAKRTMVDYIKIVAPVFYGGDSEKNNKVFEATAERLSRLFQTINITDLKGVAILKDEDVFVYI